MAVDSAIIPLRITLTPIHRPAVIAEKLSGIGTTSSFSVALVPVHPVLAEHRELHLD
jgi:hypothetical protein